jgi:hypothetical protein
MGASFSLPAISRRRMTMSKWTGFWSYVHDDDLAEGGRISRLSKDVVDQYKLITGEDISLFLDKDAIKWGEKWAEKISEGLSSVEFFIPVLTPGYFRRPKCRRELQFFARKAIDLGYKDLILPLIYIDFEDLREKPASDDLITLVQSFQWEEWKDLRFSEVTSESYRKAVARLATRLVRANRKSERPPSQATETPTQPSPPSVDDSPGFVDKLAAFEENFPKLSETLKAITEDIKLIGQLNEEAATAISLANSQGKGFTARLLVTRRLATQLAGPTDRIWSRSNEYASQLHKVDEGIRLIIEQTPEQIRKDPESKKGICDFFNGLHILSSAAQTGLASTRGMIEANEPLEKMSRDLRPALRRLRQGLTILVESGGVIDDWILLIKSSDITCE